ncbi:RNA 3'-terminal phosphate cyclase [Corchorus capsularis]|uniref:RNA 3'-terminal phosphate cyclase n=1 Tax=Corchorus capsularis TaxID=210143 RepID=A0A1R3JN03_COCAP|nr:RNA 3'-terminal phosphate cyclase [Corchorus capsularis]
MGKITYKKLKGSQNMRQRLLLATLNSTPILIEDIHADETLPGLRPHEISFLRLLEKLTDDCHIEINETGTKLKYKPGIIVGGSSLVHDCGVSRAIGYFLEPLIVLGLFARKPLFIILKGITNDSKDPSVDTFRKATLPMLKRFGVPPEGLKIEIKRRGVPPHGGGEVHLAVPTIQQLTATIWTDEGMVKRIRGIAFTSRVSVQLGNEMIYTARGIFNKLLPDVYIDSDYRFREEAGSSPGYGISLVAETTSGCFISADTTISYPRGEEADIEDEKEELMPAADVGEQMASILLEEIEKGGVVDSSHQGLLFLLCALCPKDVSKVRVGKLSPYGIETLRHIKDFLDVQFVIKPDPSTGTYLQLRRYLIVLDDVWNIRLWQEISIVFPEGLRGSRVMVTTRYEDAVRSQYVYRIQPLKEDEAWQLFCKRAFPDDVGRWCQTYLDSLARNLVEKCEGLPLTIVTLGGLMSSKKSIAEWKRVHDNLNWELSNNTALEKDYMIHRKKLVRLWMAEGFLKADNDATPEAVGESYLMELIYRSLLEVKGRNTSGRPKVIKMHDVLLEILLPISNEEKFVAVSDGGKEVKENGIHCCSVIVKGEGVQPGMSQLHSLFVFVVGDVSISWFYKLQYGFKLLRVLDLEDVPIHVLPTEIGKFFHLRYLNLTRTQVNVLPKSIGKLVNLQTLVFKGANIEELSFEIVKLQNLRHLSGFVFHTLEGPTAYVCHQITLALGNLKEADEEHLCSTIGGMKDLQNLRLVTGARSGRLKLDALLSVPPYLEKLFLNGEMERVPKA